MLNKTKLASGLAVAMGLTLLAPQADADSESQTSVKAEALAAQLKEMAAKMQVMQAELDGVKAAAANTQPTAAKVRELDDWMASMKSTPESYAPKDNLIAIRGGWQVLDHGRGNPLGNGYLVNNGNPQGFYFGGAFDYNISNDLFGLLDNTSFMVELGVEYSEFGNGKNTLTAAVPGNANSTATDSRLRIDIAPKYKFMYGSKFRPWLIPIGMDINILGVPSNAVSVLNSGMQFGGGAEYEFWRGIVMGADARYHMDSKSTNGVETDGFSLGGYLGFKY